MNTVGLPNNVQWMRALVEACTYKPGWKVHFNEGDLCGMFNNEAYYNRPYIQVEVSKEAEASMKSAGPCRGERIPWKGGKVYLSVHMCRQEVVSAVFGAIERAEMHETREWFRYNGASIFNPHLDPDALCVLASKASSFNMRKNPMTMDEA